MSNIRRPQAEEVDQLLRNAELRDELERYFDESVSRVNVQHLDAGRRERIFWPACWPGNRPRSCRSTAGSIPNCGRRGPNRCATKICTRSWDVIGKLFQKRIVLDFTDHLSDRELYCLIYRDILPAPGKEARLPSNYLHWDCTGRGGDPEIWLPTTPGGGAGRLGRDLSPAVAAALPAALSAGCPANRPEAGTSG